MNHKDGSMVSYQLLFTKPRASNVFDQHCCKAANIVQLNQLHVIVHNFQDKMTMLVKSIHEKHNH